MSGGREHPESATRPACTFAPALGRRELGTIHSITGNTAGNVQTLQLPTQQPSGNSQWVWEHRDATGTLRGTYQAQVEAFHLLLWAEVSDPRLVTSRGVQVELLLNGALIATRTILALPPTPLPEGAATVEGRLSGARVSLLSGELAWDTTLFAADAHDAGLGVALDLSYADGNAAFWRAVWPNVAGRDRLVHAPFGAGWGSLLATRILSRYELDARGTRQEVLALQDADGRFVPLEFAGTILYPGLYQPRAIPSVNPWTPQPQPECAALGVSFDVATVTRLPGGGYRLASPDSDRTCRFDADGRLVEVRRRDHVRPLKIQWQGARMLVTDSQERTATLLLKGGLVVEARDPAGRTWTFSYVGHSLTRVRQHPSGFTWAFDYDPQTGLLTRIEGPGRAPTVITRRARGPENRWAAGTVHRLVEGPYSLGLDYARSASAWRDAFAVAVTEPLGRVAAHAFQAWAPGGCAWTAARGGLVIEAKLDGAGRLEWLVQNAPLPGSRPVVLLERVGVDRAGRAFRQIDADRRSTTTTYRGFTVERTTDRGGRATTFSYTDTANVERLLTTITYPQTDPQRPAASERFTYYASGDLAVATDPIGIETTYTRSQKRGERGLPIEVTTHRGSTSVVERLQYDAMGCVVAQTNAESETTRFVWTALDRLEAVHHPDGTRTAFERDPSTFLTRRVVQPDGTQVSWDHDPATGEARTETTTGQGTTTSVRDPFGEVVEQTDPRGVRRLIERNARGLVTKVREYPTGVITQLEHDPLGFVTRERVQAPGEPDEVTDRQSDSLGQVLVTQLPEVVLPNGGRWRPQVTCRYTPTGLVDLEEFTVEPNKTEAVQYVYDARDRLIRTRRGRPPTTFCEEELAWDDAGNPTMRRGEGFYVGGTVVRGNRSRTEHAIVLDDLGQPTELRDRQGQVLASVTRDRVGRVTETRLPDSMGVLQPVERRRYEPTTGLVTSVQVLGRPAGAVKYDAQGRPEVITDALGSRTTIRWDQASRPWQVEVVGHDGKRSLVERTYTPAGDLEQEAQVVNGQRRATRYTYDERGLPTSITTPLNQTTYLRYDARGRLTARQTGRGTTRYRYDALNRLVAIAYPTHTVTRAYDAAGRLVAEEDPRTRVATTRDFLGRPEQITLTDKATGRARSLALAYDPYGQLAAVTDPEGVQTTYTHDDEDRLTKIERGGISLAQFRYDRGDRVTRVQTPGGAQHREYDALGQCTRVFGSQPAHDVAFSYDALGRKERATYQHLGAVATWRYDGLGQLEEEGLDTTRGTPLYRDLATWDEAGNRVERRQNGLRTRFTTNAFNQLQSVEQDELKELSTGSALAQADSVLDAARAARSALDGVVHPSSGPGQAFVSGNGPGEHWLQLDLGRQTSLAGVTLELPTDHGLPRGLRLEQRDAAGVWRAVTPLAVMGGRLESQASGGATSTPPSGTVGPPAPPRLVVPEVGTVNVQFAPIQTDALRVVLPPGYAATTSSDPRRANTFAVSEVRLYFVRSARLDFDYDATGNTVRAGPRTFSWDHEDRLTGVLEPGVADEQYVYGPDGSLAAELDRLGGTKVEHLYLGAERYASYDGLAGGPLEKLIAGPELDKPVGVIPYAQGRALEASFFFSTGLGSTHQVVTASGQTTETRLTNAWGEPITVTGIGLTSAAPQRSTSRFAGRPSLGTARTGLLDYRARAYQPKFGRFLSADPSGTQDGLNRYAYVHGDPVNLRDPDGRVAGVDNAIAGGVSVLLGWGIARLTGQEYSLRDAVVDFTIGAVSNGVSTVAKGAQLARALGAVARNPVAQQVVVRAATTVGAATVGTAFDTAGAYLKGGKTWEEHSVATSFAVNTAVSLVGQGAGAAFRRLFPGCFLAGTLVATPDGQKRIEEVKPGDLVLSRDEATGQQAYKQVIRLFRGRTDAVVHLEVAEIGSVAQPSSPDAQTLRCTTEHPFWVVGKGWVEARLLEVGDELIGSGGQELRVVGHEVRREEADHYNFEVEAWHTYFVAGDVNAPAVWVHNRCAEAMWRDYQDAGGTWSRKRFNQWFSELEAGPPSRGFPGHESGHHVPGVRKTEDFAFAVSRADKSRPVFFFQGDAAAQGRSHWMLHHAERPFVGPRQGSFPGSAGELMNAHRWAYKHFDDILVDVRSPDGSVLLGNGLTPSEGLNRIQIWLMKQGMH